MSENLISLRAKVVIQQLELIYPNPKIALNYSNNFELLVAVMLSAQCTDKKVNEVTSQLFLKYPNLDSYVNADQAEFEQDIRQTGFYRMKAKNVLGTARKIQTDFGGKVPDTMDQLLTLPGVARKTANVVLGVAFGKNEGVTVDTHVTRLANKFGLTENKDPIKIERDLMQIIPRDKWRDFSLALVLYGREYSTARQKNDWDDPISVALFREKLISVS